MSLSKETGRKQGESGLSNLFLSKDSHIDNNIFASCVPADHYTGHQKAQTHFSVAMEASGRRKFTKDVQ